MGLPSAPIFDQPIAIGDESLTLYFKPSKPTEAPFILGYMVRVQPGDREVQVASSPVTITDLDNGDGYSFEVQAITAVGKGPWSELSPEVKPGRPRRSMRIAGQEGPALAASLHACRACLPDYVMTNDLCTPH